MLCVSHPQFKTFGLTTPTHHNTRIILVQTLESQTNMESIWSKEDLKEAERREVKIIYENFSSPSQLDEKGLPSDIHIITYEIDGETRLDAARAYKMVDIFDVYYDKLRLNGKVVDIRSGYGLLKPKLWKGEIPPLLVGS